MRTNYNGRETVIGPANVGRIHELWRAPLGGAMIAQPVEAAGVLVHGVRMNLIFEGTEDGGFYALRADTGKVVWQRDLGSLQTTCRDLPNGVFGIGGAGAIAFSSKHTGAIYVAGGDGAVYKLNLATGADEPGWPLSGVFDPEHETVYGGLNLFDKRLYVAVASHCDDAPYYGGVVEISVAQHAIAHRFYPAGQPSGAISGGGVWGPAGVSIDPSNRHVFAATGNALTTPDNYLYSDAVVDLYQSLGLESVVQPLIPGTDVDFGATPVLFRPADCPHTLLAAENKRGVLFVYPEGELNLLHQQLLQVADAARGGFTGDPAWDPVTDTLYVADTSDSNVGIFKHGLLALKPAGNCKLSLAWQRSVGPKESAGLPPPTAANGVVYYGDGRGHTEFALDAANGRRLWQSRTITGGIFAAATIVNGKLFVPSWDGYLYAFG